MNQRIKSLGWTMLLVVLFTACSYRPEPVSQGRKEVWKVENGDSVLYVYEDELLTKSYTLKKNLKVGPCKSYYPNGKVKISTDYKDGMKHGKSLYYYESGQLFRETEYKYSNMDGLRKVYFENGQIQAEIPHKDDHVIPGTREWKEDGTEVKHNLEIRISEKDKIAFENKLVVTLRLNKKTKKVRFFEDVYETGDFEAFKEIPSKGNVATVSYTVSKGDFIMRKARYYALVCTKMGNPMMLEKVYNLSADNYLSSRSVASSLRPSIAYSRSQVNTPLRVAASISLTSKVPCRPIHPASSQEMAKVKVISNICFCFCL